MNDDKYGIWWSQADRRGRAVGKQKFFSTDAARNKFTDALTSKPNFIEIMAWADPISSLISPEDMN